MSGSAQASKLIDNERVIVTRYMLRPGDNTGWHVHGHDYVIVPLTGGKLRIETAQGANHAEMVSGQPYFREAGVEHDVINADASDITFLEVEIR